MFVTIAANSFLVGKQVTIFIKHGLHVETQDDNGETPLFFCHDNALDALIASGANVNHRNKKGESILEIKLEKQRVYLFNFYMKLFACKQLDYHVNTKKGKSTALHEIARFTKYYGEDFSKLCKTFEATFGENLVRTMLNDDKKTILQVFIDNADQHAIIDFFEYPDSQKYWDQPVAPGLQIPVHYWMLNHPCIKSSDGDYLHSFIKLDKKMKPTAPVSVLSCAILSELEDCVHRILNNPEITDEATFLSVNEPDTTRVEQRLPLVLAAHVGNLTIFTELLEIANIEQCYDAVLQAAWQNKKFKFLFAAQCTKALIIHDSVLVSLFNELIRTNPFAFEFVLEVIKVYKKLPEFMQKLPANIVDGEQVLFVACESCNSTAYDWLSTIVPLNVQAIRNDKQQTLVHVVATASIANVNTREGRTNMLDSVTFLSSLLKGAANATTLVNVQDAQGNTALHYACQHGNYLLFAALCEAGAQQNVKNSQGKQPIDLAAENADKFVFKSKKRKTTKTDDYSKPADVSTRSTRARKRAKLEDE